MSIKVAELKTVTFPAGYLRTVRGVTIKHVSWNREYTMHVPKGRRGVWFSDYHDKSDEFNKAALKRCFTSALSLTKLEGLVDERTQIKIRRLDGPAVEIDMPCGENCVIKITTLKRLIKELA